jgi:hypothetical protein
MVTEKKNSIHFQSKEIQLVVTPPPLAIFLGGKGEFFERHVGKEKRLGTGS